MYKPFPVNQKFPEIEKPADTHTAAYCLYRIYIDLISIEFTHSFFSWTQCNNHPHNPTLVSRNTHEDWRVERDSEWVRAAHAYSGHGAGDEPRLPRPGPHVLRPKGPGEDRPHQLQLYLQETCSVEEPQGETSFETNLRQVLKRIITGLSPRVIIYTEYYSLYSLISNSFL